MAQQLSRPGLACLLDAEEARLPLAEDDRRTMTAIRDRIEEVLGRCGLGETPDDLRVVAEDLLHIARGLLDGAAKFGDPAPNDMERRVLAALRGYLRERGGPLAAQLRPSSDDRASGAITP